MTARSEAPSAIAPVRLTRWLSGAAVAFAVVTLGVYVVRRASGLRESPVASEAGVVLPPNAVAPVEVHARVVVRPSGARVSVNGSPREVVDGAITITGAVGETARVVVEEGSQRAEGLVALTADGGAVPDVVALPEVLSPGVHERRAAPPRAAPAARQSPSMPPAASSAPAAPQPPTLNTAW